QSALLLPRLIPTAPPLEFEYPDIANLVQPKNLLFDNGYGGFSPDGKEYVIFLDPEKPTPAAWINVIANPTFGCLVSDHGSGYTWAENSSENRLTPWNNDPISDQPGEVLYLRDEEDGQFWSPLPAPVQANSPFIVHHSAGQTYFEHYSHQLLQETRIFVSPDDPVKIIKLSLENKSKKNRRITATIYVEWVLGSSRETMQSFLIPEYSSKHNALLVRNPYNSDFSERVAFVAANKEVHGLTTDRTEFIGRHQTLANPAALKRVGLTGNVSPRGDPCSVIQVYLWLAPGDKKEINFLLGEGADRTHATQIIEKYLPDDQVDAALNASMQFWDDVLGTIQVNTPDNAMNIILNRWLLYQSLSCRIWGRSALYQSGGAYGFRDQLQDVMALAMHGRLASMARQQILESARHQFPEGDVLHWWHPPSGKGIRSRCSDDLLWLPYVTSYYVNATGDTSILDEIIPFLSGDILGTEEEERYGQFAISDENGTLLDHCKRAIQKASTSGAHGIPLMNGGDWNDGMNRVGINGKGESIWLGWFLYATLEAFGQIVEMREGNSLSQSYRRQAASLREALEKNAWDGEWYIRAFYDDGTPLGSSTSEECKIDSIAQSWGVLSGAAAPERARKAMQSVVDKLVKPDIQIVQLFNPPFDKTTHDPGYIKGYLPGIRENGGQYTHAAEWVSLAF
ncbi:MAG TPA: protein ndvB, partial [Leptolinea sp.]